MKLKKASNSKWSFKVLFFAFGFKYAVLLRGMQNLVGLRKIVLKHITKSEERHSSTSRAHRIVFETLCVDSFDG
jgi:hypothetical protein